jgi:putative sigma-54 modulation protein
MRINITARHFKLSDELRDFTEKELHRLKKYYDQIIDAEVILEWQKIHRTAEIKMSVYGTMLTAQAQAEEMHKAVNSAIDKMERQLIKYKDKLRNFDHEKTAGETITSEIEDNEARTKEY